MVVGPVDMVPPIATGSLYVPCRGLDRTGVGTVRSPPRWGVGSQWGRGIDERVPAVSPRWSNWAGNVTARPDRILDPRDEAELAGIVAEAASRSRTVKVVGSGHSFTPAAATDGTLVRIGSLSGIRSIDRDKMLVTVGAGTTLSDLNVLLESEGLAMPNLGDIVYQTVAGAISTSTHGTGRELGGLATRVRGVRLIDGTGRVVRIDAESNPHLLGAAAVSVGAVGALSEVTLEVVPAFRLRAREQPMRLDAVLEQVHELVQTNDHFEFFWVPHTGWALTKRNNRTEDPADPLPRVRNWFDKTLMENHAFGLLCRLGRLRPGLIPRLATALPSSGRREYVDSSWKIFASRRLVKFYEMEYAIPADAVVSAVSEVRATVERKGYLLNFPVEVRFTAADDLPLSTAHGRASAYVAVHVFKGMSHEAYFRDVEAIMSAHAGRPHWGKIHHRTSGDLSALYPQWNDFLRARDELDPNRTFANDYTRRVFGD